jgi:hypothetical protein
MIRLACTLALLPGIALAAGHVTGTVTDGNMLAAPPAAWLGEVPHLVMMGTVNGYAFDVQFPDMAAATDVAEFAAKREYLAEGDRHRYIDFEFALEAVIAGAEKAIELEFENADLSSVTLPAALALTDSEFPEGAFSNMEVEFEWEIDGTSVNEEIAGWSGTFTYALDTGTKDDKGLLPDGFVGGFVTATRGADSLVISFTVPVAEYEIED